jgi:UDP-N-acetylglucosamine transferase subunit ALG13
VFDEFAPEPILDPKPIQRVVVTLGTITFGFRRLVERLITVLPSGCEVLWQVGETDVCALGINARDVVPSGELRDAMRRADVVIAHAGIGSALAAMEAGRCPVLVPRERDRGEHIDDHQQQIAATLDHLGLAIHRSAEAIDLADLVEASKRRTAKRPAPPMLPIAVGAATMATPSPTSRRDSDQSSCR